MNILDAIEMRRSIRAYSPGAVEKEKLEAVVKAGSLAPVFGHFHMTVIENADLLGEINLATLNMMKHSGDDFLEKRAAQPRYHPLYGAPVMIVLSAPGGNDGNGFNMANVSCAAENMIIQATALGLGTCFVMGPMISFADKELAKRAGIPDDQVPLVGVLLGYPREALQPNPRKASSQVTYVR